MVSFKLGPPDAITNGRFVPIKLSPIASTALNSVRADCSKFEKSLLKPRLITPSDSIAAFVSMSRSSKEPLNAVAPALELTLRQVLLGGSQ